MASNAVSGVGTKFYRWNSVSATWEALAEVNSISGPSMTRDFIDVTSLDSTGGYREFIAGFRDGGTVNLTMNFTRSTYDKMKADFENDAAQHYEVVLPDTGPADTSDVNTSFEFRGLVTELPLEIPTDDKITANVTIKIDGKVLVNSGGGSASAGSI